MKDQEIRGLYSPAFEHDNCGIGAVVNKDGRKSHLTVERALHIVENLEHRAGKDAEGKTGDGPFPGGAIRRTGTFHAENPAFRADLLPYD